jgi:hypothetical protein
VCTGEQRIVLSADCSDSVVIDGGESTLINTEMNGLYLTCCECDTLEAAQ